MSYIKFEKIAKKFDFFEVLGKDNAPAYLRQYIKKEAILIIYKTKRDHAVFTDSKLVLFDNSGHDKNVYTIPYKSINYLSINFGKDNASLNLYLASGYPLNIRFINMNGTDKLRLRILYTIIDKIVCGLEPVSDDVNLLVTNKVKL